MTYALLAVIIALLGALVYLQVQNAGHREKAVSAHVEVLNDLRQLQVRSVEVQAATLELLATRGRTATGEGRAALRQRLAERVKS